MMKAGELLKERVATTLHETYYTGRSFSPISRRKEWIS